MNRSKKSYIKLNTLNRENQGEMLSNKARAIMSGRQMIGREEVQKGLDDNSLTVNKPQQETDSNRPHQESKQRLQNEKENKRKKNKNYIPANDSNTNWEENIDNTTTTPKKHNNIGLQLSPDNENPYNVYRVKRPEFYPDDTNLAYRFGGKSKRRKSKTKSCCSVRKSAKVCRRKTDNKKFRLPRRFSRKTCLAKKPRGFTMRSSCAPYKGCKKTRKGGSGPGTLPPLTHEEISEIKNMPITDEEIRLANNNPTFIRYISGIEKDKQDEEIKKTIIKARLITASLKKLPENDQDIFLYVANQMEQITQNRNGGYKKSSYKTRKNKKGGHHELLLLIPLLFADKKKSKTKSKTKKNKNKRQ